MNWHLPLAMKKLSSSRGNTYMNRADIEQFLVEQNAQIKPLSGALQLDRIGHFLELLDNPQEKIKMIHVAGTSGKGSTAYLTSLLLHACNFKVGFYQSPPLLDLREMFQINNQPISEEKFTSYFIDLLHSIEKAKSGQHGALSSFEILTSLAFYIFWKEGVHYAVVETGLGGLYDATNTVRNKDKLVILTKIGLDHTDILGSSITSIATHKAGIIQKGNSVVSIWQDKQARTVIDETVKSHQAKLFYLKKLEHYTIRTIDIEKTVIDFRFLDTYIGDIHLGLVGKYQAENCSLALATLFLLSKRDHFAPQQGIIQQALQNAHFPGRLEIMKVPGKMVILDGAHNPQKMASLIKNLKALLPAQNFDFVVAFKKGKDYVEMLQSIASLANKITITSFHTMNMALVQDAEEPLEIGRALTELGFINFEIDSNPKEALKNALASSKNPLVITGSFYLIGSIYSFLETVQ
jgi:dihydrofolate synthase/folylpolyglutamate synthase